MLADGGDGWSHIVCMPGVTTEHIDRFLSDLVDTEGLRAPGAPPARRARNLSPAAVRPAAHRRLEPTR
jgi:hypothetical protein